MQKKHNKEITERAVHGASGGEYNHLKAHMAIEEDDDAEDASYQLDDGMSRLSLDDDDKWLQVCALGMLWKHQLKKEKQPECQQWDVLQGQDPAWTALHHGCLDRFQASEAGEHPGSPSFWVAPSKEMSFRVLTDKREFVLSVALDKHMMTPEASFNTAVLNNEVVKSDASGAARRLYETVLDQHPKTIARRRAIANLKGRDSSKEKIIEEHRIPLPMRCQHRYVSKAEDDIFNGCILITYPNKSIHLHAELIGEQKDNYSPMKSDLSVKSANADFMPRVLNEFSTPTVHEERETVYNSPAGTGVPTEVITHGKMQVTHVGDVMSLSGQSIKSHRSKRAKAGTALEREIAMANAGCNNSPTK